MKRILLLIAALISPEITHKTVLAQQSSSLGIWEAKHLSLNGAEYCAVSATNNSGMITLSLSNKSPLDLNFSLINQAMASAVSEKAPQVILSFDNGDHINLNGSRGALEVDIILREAQVRQFTHDFTAAHSMTITVGSGQLLVGTWSLNGTTPAITAMGECTKTYLPSAPPPFIGQDQASIIPSNSDQLPDRPGNCTFTQVKDVEERLSDGNGKWVADSGSAISLTNGGYQVSYDQIPAVDTARAGDRVMMCLVQLPTNCPKGDNRGKVYTTTDLRTMQSWTLPDSEHDCGGA